MFGDGLLKADLRDLGLPSRTFSVRACVYFLRLNSFKNLYFLKILYVLVLIRLEKEFSKFLVIQIRIFQTYINFHLQTLEVLTQYKFKKSSLVLFRLCGLILFVI